RLTRLGVFADVRPHSHIGIPRLKHATPTPVVIPPPVGSVALSGKPPLVARHYQPGVGRINGLFITFGLRKTVVRDSQQCDDNGNTKYIFHVTVVLVLYI